MVCAAYREYRTRRDVKIEQARKEAIKEERARVKRIITAWGVAVPPDV